MTHVDLMIGALALAEAAGRRNADEGDLYNLTQDVLRTGILTDGVRSALYDAYARGVKKAARHCVTHRMREKADLLKGRAEEALIKGDAFAKAHYARKQEASLGQPSNGKCPPSNPAPRIHDQG